MQNPFKEVMCKGRCAGFKKNRQIASNNHLQELSFIISVFHELLRYKILRKKNNAPAMIRSATTVQEI